MGECSPGISHFPPIGRVEGVGATSYVHAQGRVCGAYSKYRDQGWFADRRMEAGVVCASHPFGSVIHGEGSNFRYPNVVRRRKGKGFAFRGPVDGENCKIRQERVGDRCFRVQVSNFFRWALTRIFHFLQIVADRCSVVTNYNRNANCLHSRTSIDSDGSHPFRFVRYFSGFSVSFYERKNDSSFGYL